MRNFSKLLIILFVLVCYSCNKDSDVSINDDLTSTELPNVLKFDSNDQLNEFLSELKEESSAKLNSEVIVKKLAEKRHIGGNGLRAVTMTPFISLVDSLRKSDLAFLTKEDWDVINSDPENPVYEPVDSIIYDMYFASVINTNRELQVGTSIYKYTAEGIYSVSENNYALLSTVGTSSGLRGSTDSRITFYPGTNSNTDDGLRTTYPNLSNNNLTLKSGNITIAANKIRDLNYRDRGDANGITNWLTNILGRDIVAINKFSSNRQMILTCYDQDFLIYKCMGIHVKMQKKLLGIWWNIDASDLRAGWGAVELIEKYDVPPYLNAPQPTFTPNFYSNLKDWETRMPIWLTKNFPFSDNYALFTVPIINYDVTTFNLNQVYSSALGAVDKSIKSWMKAENKSTGPKDPGLAAYEDAYKANYVIASSETEPKKRSSIQKNFESDWFGGTYTIGYSTDPTNPNFNYKKFTFTIKGKDSHYGRLIVYGAVKYDNEWRACRIVKTDRDK